MKGADQVLALRQVDAGLAADRGIHLREQARRHLHEAHAAAQNRGGKAGEVAHHAAAEGNHDVAALHAELEQSLAKLGEHGKTFARFAGCHHRLAEEDVLLTEACLQRAQIERRYIGIAHQCAARAGRSRGDARAGLGRQVFADDDVIAAAAKANLDGDPLVRRGGASCIIASCCGCSRPGLAPCSRVCGTALPPPRSRSPHGARHGFPQ